jgi:N-ATPase, AtpR subunit
MTPFDLPAHDLIRTALSLGAWLCAGALIGTIHFATLRWNTLVFADGRSILLPIGIQFARFVATGAMLFGIARFFGALPLLDATVGILVARTIAVRRERQS